jgi:outer membrane receptor for Fe3+-dicitrate
VLKKKLELVVTGFNRTINDVIIYGFTGYENRDKQHDFGAELEIGYAVNKQITIKANYAYTDGRITQTITGKTQHFITWSGDPNTTYICLPVIMRQKIYLSAVHSR